jgi:hypothetical protein
VTDEPQDYVEASWCNFGWVHMPTGRSHSGGFTRLRPRSGVGSVRGEISGDSVFRVVGTDLEDDDQVRIVDAIQVEGLVHCQGLGGGTQGNIGQALPAVDKIGMI